MSAVVGIDGGCPGGAVQIAPDGSLLWAAFWDEVEDGERIEMRVAIRSFAPPHDWVVETYRLLPMASMVGMVLRDVATRFGPTRHRNRRTFPHTAVAVEGVFVGPDKSIALQLQRDAQAQVSHLEVGTHSRARWILATNWRKEVLELKFRTKTKVAKEASMTRVPPMLPGFPEGLVALDLGNAAHHVTDAGGVALCLRDRMAKQRRAS